jgi:hypothetical protein
LSQLPAHSLNTRACDLPVDRERGFGIGNRLRTLAELVPRQARVPQRVRLAPALADVTRNCQLLRVKVNRQMKVARVHMGIAEIAQRVRLALPVVDLTHDLQLLFVELDGACSGNRCVGEVGAIGRGFGFKDSRPSPIPLPQQPLQPAWRGQLNVIHRLINGT